MAVPLIEIRNASKTFGGVVRALDNVSIKVNEREMVGVVGENGAGKTTLMKIMVGVHQSDGGEWFYKGAKTDFPRNPREAARMGVAIVYQEDGVIPALKVYEYLFLGREDKFVHRTRLLVDKMKVVARDILQEFNIDCDVNQFMHELPLSTQKMVEIARAVLGLRLEHGDDVESVIILDEPTAPLTIEERQELFESLLELKKNISFVFVSHIMHEVLQFCDRVYVLRDAKLVGEYNFSEQEFTEADLFRVIVGHESVEREFKPADPVESRKKLLSLRNLSRRGSYYDISFDLFSGECIGIFGPASSGKKEIIRTIAGLEEFGEGTLEFMGRRLKPAERLYKRCRAGIGYFSGDIDKHLVPHWPIKRNISIANIRKILRKTRLIDFKAEKEMAEGIKERFRVRAPSVNTECRTLSGGNKQKISFGKWFERHPDVLLLEDPTIGIDVGAREDIYEAVYQLKEEGVGMILVSDDPKEYIRLCDRVLMVRDGKVYKTLDNKELKEAMEV
jgi:ABC-type sugar transport system ATPase subunit